MHDAFRQGWRGAVAGLAALLAAGAAGQTGGASDVEMSRISGPPEAPRRHFRLRDPANVSPREAEDAYGIVKAALAAGYARSGLPAARAYQGWRRFNRAPYLSSRHGNHYLNNYANEIARDYGRFEAAGRLPVGSVIAKDSFAITRTGQILLGPLFLMEKMAKGFNYVSGDWKYTMVRPDGTVLGETNGEGSAKVEYCVTCHLAVERQDHLYFVPEGARARPND